MEQNYRSNCLKLKEETMNLQKLHSDRETELLNSIENLKSELDDKNLQIGCLQNNVDTLHGGIHVLNREIKNHGQEMQKIQNSCEKKIRFVYNIFVNCGHDFIIRTLLKIINWRKHYLMNHWNLEPL